MSSAAPATRGSAIAREAAPRGHAVTSYSRQLPDDRAEGVEHVAGSVLDQSVRDRALDGADVVVVALAPRGDMAEQMRPAVASLIADAEAAGVRLGVVGGAGSLHVAEGGPRLVDTPEFPEALTPEVLTMAAILDDLKATPEGLDWFLDELIHTIDDVLDWTGRDLRSRHKGTAPGPRAHGAPRTAVAAMATADPESALEELHL